MKKQKWISVLEFPLPRELFVDDGLTRLNTNENKNIHANSN